MAVVLTDMNMPGSCNCCEFGIRIDNASCMCNRKPMEAPIEDGDPRPDWCPLKEYCKWNR